jgi:benzoyl-CoA 2,3-dioxygenase component B
MTAADTRRGPDTHPDAAIDRGPGGIDDADTGSDTLHTDAARFGEAPEPTGPLSTIDYSEQIPNNVDLASDRKLQRALERWQPKFLDWWKNLGPSLPTQDVYLRTAVAIGRDGWAHFDHVPMEQYRWGIFLAERDPERTVAFGAHKGEPAWQEVPGEYRSDLRRLITIQGDTEPASVEQQRHLGATAPSLYDMRNLFQVNVEEGRHLWAMVYLLQAYFGKDGREEAEQLLARNSGDVDTPRILGAFNEETTDWLSFFMFTHFTDRDGKYQLGTLKESAFDPLARTCEFMLKEEAHHMFVGTTGVQRVVERSAELTVEHGTDDIWAFGGIPLPVLQKYLNFHFSVSMDLFGSEVSTNAANYFTNGLKGRWMETRRKDDHVLRDLTMEVGKVADGAFVTETVPMLNALNLDLRNEYAVDCGKGVKRWNGALEKAGLEMRLTVPHEGFNRQVGAYRGTFISPDGTILDEAAWTARADEWLPTAEDREHVAQLMKPEFEPGKFAGWIAPPPTGINAMPVEFDYVRF